MNILYVITGLGIGGAERVTVDLADQMEQHGHNVKIAYLTGDILTRPRSSNIEIIYLGLENFSTLFRASKAYRTLIRQYQPDVVHSHMVHANIFTRLNRIFYQVKKLICTAHSSNEGGFVRMIAYRLTNRYSDLNTNVSQDATRALIKKGAFNHRNLITVYNGIDLNKFKSVNNRLITNDYHKSKQVSILSIGRLNEQKDYPNLIHAVARVKRASSLAVKFYIAGDGKLYFELKELIEKLDLKNDIILLGNQKDIPSLLNNAHFFILSSKSEGLPTVLIEAMACETFVISTDCGGSAEIMGSTGILVKPCDPERLAQAILQALDLSVDSILENNLKARKRVEELFSLERSVDKWLRLYGFK